MSSETLDADFYRQQARMCHQLAVSAGDARPLFARLFALAKAYEEKAEAADLAERRGTKISGSFNRGKSFAATAG
jgi:hypothetical protein